MCDDGLDNLDGGGWESDTTIEEPVDISSVKDDASEIPDEEEPAIELDDTFIEETVEPQVEPIEEEPVIEVDDMLYDVTEEIQVGTDVTESDAMDHMTEYLSEHNYGRDDYETYSQDPEWQQLNNDLLMADGKEPIDYEAQTVERVVLDSDTALSNMNEYLSEHNYGRDDYETYSQDPEWQQLNNDLLMADGKEPIEYSSYELTEGAQTVIPEFPDDETTAEVEEVESGTQSAETLDLEITEYMDEASEESVSLDESVTTESLKDIHETEEDSAVQEPDENELIAPNPEDEEIAKVPVETDQEAMQETEDLTVPAEEDLYVTELVTEYPEMQDFYENGVFYQQGFNEYGFEGTCGPTTQANTLNELLDTNIFTENRVLNLAVEENLCDVSNLDHTENGGTTTEQFVSLYDKLNESTSGQIDVQCYDYDRMLGIEDMAAHLEQGSLLNVAVDSCALWGEPRQPGDFVSDHWICVDGVDRNETGAVTGFHIIDSGGGVDYLDTESFQRCIYGSESGKVVDPTCIVVSKK